MVVRVSKVLDQPADGILRVKVRENVLIVLVEEDNLL